MLSVCCHKYTKTHETLTNNVLCTLMQTSWEVGTLAWALIRQRSWSSCGDSVESDGFLGSGEGEDDPDSEESDFE